MLTRRRLPLSREPAKPLNRFGYRVKPKTPRAEDNTSMPSDRVTALSPPSKPVYAFSNAIVGHAALVHASPGPAVKVRPDNANPPLHTLQSTRVDRRPSVSVRV